MIAREPQSADPPPPDSVAERYPFTIHEVAEHSGVSVRAVNETAAAETLMLPAAVQFRRDLLGMPLDESLAMLADILEVLLLAADDGRDI